MNQRFVPPIWPYPEIIRPHAHRSGYWRLRRKGRDIYLARIEDPDEALAFYHKHREQIESGKPIEVDDSHDRKPSNARSITLKTALDEHLDRRLAESERGDIEYTSYLSDRDTCKLIIRSLGRHTPILDLGPTDYARLLASWSAHSVHTRRRNVGYTKRIIRNVFERHGLGAPYFGPDFKPPSDRALRKHRIAKGDRSLDREHVLRLINNADPRMRALLLLGINGGYGPTDVSHTMCSDVDLGRGRIDHTRKKTGVRRCVPLWPKTVEAIEPFMGEPDQPLFRSRTGRPIVHDTTNPLSDWFRSLADSCALPNAQFYDLRRTFRTIADQLGDDRYTRIVMGHTERDIDDIYKQQTFWPRLQRITDHVHAWLFTGADHSP